MSRTGCGAFRATVGSLTGFLFFLLEAETALALRNTEVLG